MALEDKQVPEDIEVPANLKAALRARLYEGKLPCAEAFAIVDNLSIPPHRVGQAADVEDIRLSRCQLGLFGYEQKQGWTEDRIEHKDPPPGFEEAVRVELNPQGELSCRRAWQMAERMGIPRLQMGCFVEQLGIRIAPCQLGAF